MQKNTRLENTGWQKEFPIQHKTKLKRCSKSERKKNPDTQTI